jgi:hypothetical protein
MHKELNILTKTLPSNAVREVEQRQNGDEAVGEGEVDPLLGGKPRESPSGLRGLFLKFVEPQKYASFRSDLTMLDRTRLGEPVPAMPEEDENAYLNPALTAKPPRLWIARDGLGTSKKLMHELPKEIQITDEGAWVDEKGNVYFDKQDLRQIPIWKDKVYY